MSLTILDTNFIQTNIIDNFESLLWVDRYAECGDFELFTSVTDEIINALKSDYYLINSSSDHVMIVEDIKIKSDVENGNTIAFSGRSVESILDRRIVWNQTTIDGNLQDGIVRLLNENIINPTDVNRKISNFNYELSTDVSVTSLTLNAQYIGLTLLEVIKGICDSNKIGFKIKVVDGVFIFSLYAGIDRSYDQTVNPYVEFTPKFDNLLNSNYEESNKALKTVSLVVGEGEATSRLTTIIGDSVELSRREIFTDGSNISRTVDTIVLTEVEYKELLKQRGVENLLLNSSTELFDGEVDTTQTYKIGEDFFIGDVVQIANEYGMESKSRVTEIIYSKSIEGMDVYPTFVKVK